MIRRVTTGDRDIFLEMCREFYATDAVTHAVSEDNFAVTFDNVVNGNPYCDGAIVEYEGKTVGYGLISYSYSNEAGGMVMWLEELYIRESYRSKGLGKEFFDYCFSLRGDIKRYRLEVTECNRRAAALYSRLGFNDLPYTQMIKDI